eukprot:TRINITY_DN49968_c0_g1_i1.p1 TRINITY_DN49968_c0_g1~~TRINITY_DN49968_c0_g1_i1.p1  ORF type:complete len:497 (+),score=157.40 TRINITY_DN49968_c0_g1_i1:125-1492(+)
MSSEEGRRSPRRRRSADRGGDTSDRRRSRSRSNDRRGGRLVVRRSRSRDKDRGEPCKIRIGVQAGPRGDVIYPQHVEDFLRQWADDVGHIETGVAPLDIDEPGWQFVLVEILEPRTRHRILEWFNSPRGRRYLVLRDMAVKVQEWPLRRLAEDDREAEVIPWKWRKGASAMLSDEYPDEKVLALDSAEGRRYYFKSEDIHRTEGAASFVDQKRKGGGETKRTVCHHWRRDAHCRFGSECAYIHVKAGAGREDAGSGPSANAMISAGGKGRFLQAERPRGDRPGGPGGGKGIPPPTFAPPQQGAAPPDWDEESESSTEEEPPAPPPAPRKEDYQDTLLVRDVDKDTDARGIRRMGEDDFVRMWCEIDGYKSAQLVREKRRSSNANPKYGGSHGVVIFKNESQAVDAMEQTFGCGLNVSLFGVEEMLQTCIAEQKQVLDRTGGYSDLEARKLGRVNF